MADIYNKINEKAAISVRKLQLFYWLTCARYVVIYGKFSERLVIQF